MIFQKATRTKLFARVALTGPSGSGKTYSALSIASHLVPGGKIAVIDTEHGSARLYANRFDFDVVELQNFHPDRYIEAIQSAESAGYDVLIIDSLSHAWAGQGGVLELVDRKAAEMKTPNTFRAWGEGTKTQNALIEAILGAKLHVLWTMRTKTAYAQTEENGKSKVVKLGMQPIQRENVEYEAGVILSMDMDNTATVDKSRCEALATGQRFVKPGETLAVILREWLDAGEGERVPDTTVNQDEVDLLNDLGQQCYGDDWISQRRKLCESVSRNEATAPQGLTVDQLMTLIDGIRNKLDGPAQPHGSAS